MVISRFREVGNCSIAWLSWKFFMFLKMTTVKVVSYVGKNWWICLAMLKLHQRNHQSLLTIWSSGTIVCMCCFSQFTLNQIGWKPYKTVIGTRHHFHLLDLLFWNGPLCWKSFLIVQLRYIELKILQHKKKFYSDIQTTARFIVMNSINSMNISRRKFKG
jgi:hypothetical protein